MSAPSAMSTVHWTTSASVAPAAARATSALSTARTACAATSSETTRPDASTPSWPPTWIVVAPGGTTATWLNAGLRTSVHRADVEDGTEETGESLALEIVGQDRQGIVRAISGELARLGVNVVELATDCSQAPWSGERLFKTNAKILLPGALDADTVRGKIEAIAPDLMVELKNDPS